MFGLGKRKAWCNVCRRPQKQCVCRPCTCGGVAQPTVTQVQPQPQPQPMRIEHLVHLVPPSEPQAQPIALGRPAEPQPQPKEAPLDDWREFDNNWMEETWSD